MAVHAVRLRNHFFQGNPCSRRKSAIASAFLVSLMPRFPFEHLADLSRDRRFLIRISLSIVVMSVALSLVLALYLPRKVSELMGGTPDEFTERSLGHNNSESIPTSIDDWVFWIRFQLPQHFDYSLLDFRALSDTERGFIPFLRNSPFEEFPLLEAYYLGLVDGGVEQAIDCLLYTSPSPRDFG